MSKCGKSFMPECEYFTTGGCISPFNCIYKIASEYFTTVTSTPSESIDKELKVLTIEDKKLEEGKVCQNLTEINPVDEFICSRCGFMTEDFCRLVIDEDDGEHYHYEYEIKYCPNCGAKVENQQ